ncbi:MAG: neutral/alkaline non-lysosomal ceramidase N-terminal domain-containing protein, partial [Verrucomicrobiales bacterium]|nr:neutral/alkaline non-lysosomal ceramidase N-terminal domain-containing protein [Verrucomicrobiales bacterium]
MKTLRWWFLLAALGLSISTLEAAESAALEVIGTARVDITPSYPIRLTGYAARTNLASGREQTLWAKALAMGSDAAGPRVLITVDNCGVPAHVVEEVAGRLALRVRLPRENFCVASSHTHSGPMVRGFAENIFVRDLTSEEAAASDRYTVELMDHLERVALAALRTRRPGKLFRAEGRVGFGANRRTPGGPVDPTLPILVARDLNGKVMAVVANYACHCTTLGHQVNRSHGDWAGFAQEFIEADHAGAQAMITIGCGADTNPSPRGGDDFGVGWARTHARALATQVQGLVAGAMEELTVLPRTAYRRVLLPFEATPDRAGWETRAKESGIVGFHARKNLDRLGRGVPLPTHLPYFVQTWSFGERYAMVFLAGEVVVDYALRLKRDYDPARLWITAYANDVPCYIPSKRILQEGGYEAETSLWYYDRPARLKPEVEDLIHRTVGEILAPGFRAAPRAPTPGAGLPPPRTPAEGLRAFRLPPGLRIEAVATEPLVESPVAIDFGSDGRLWVCEMRDYPMGLDGAGSPGGRIKVLTDRDGDGRYDEAKVVADELPFPTGLMAWRDGVLVGAAPDVLWIPEAAVPARGVSDPRVAKRLSGFATHNYQARVNGLRWGLDGWVHASGGLFGGRIRSSLAKVDVDCSGRDFRFRPDTGEIEALSGVSQIVRCRDDYGEWFGNDNGSLLWHFPLAARYGRANPRVATPAAHVGLDRDGTRVFPASETLERFNDPHTANHLTSACGPEIYRDGLLGKEYAGNAFVCEPVHNLVRRAVLSPDGITFRATRAESERDREFLASEDSWFRPVEVRTGPDGGLWVVDFHRLIVEHPRWIPEDRLRTLDVRAGADRGRIYRVIPEGGALRPVRAWALAEDAALVQGLASSNGPARDLAQRELWMRHGKGGADRSVLAAIEGLAQGGHPAARVQAWFTLASLARENACDWRRVLDERDPKVLRAILPVWEGREGVASGFESWLGARVTASGPGAESFPTSLLFQVILSQGQVGGDGMGGRWEMLARAMSPALNDPWIRAAVLASCRTTAEAAMEALRPWDRSEAEGAPLWDGLLRTLAGEGRLEWVRRYWATAFVGEAARARMQSER